jgi:hypothetical protein
MKTSAEINAIAVYLAEIDRIWHTGNATEHSYRGALQQMLSALMPGLTVLNEPKKQACGAPDYIIADRTGRAVSFVEAKDIGDADLDGCRRTGHKEQFDRYKASLDAIAFTDYLDFRLYLHGEKAVEVKIAELRSAAAGSRSPSAAAGRIVPLTVNFNAFLALVDSLATAHPAKIGSATQLARLMAGKARLLQHTALEFLTRSGDDNPRDGEPPKTDVGRILSDFRRALVPDIGADEFADVYAQTITYGMFAARLHDRTPEDFSRFEASALIPKSNPFLKQLFNHLSGNMDDEIEWVVNDIAALFAVADVAKIMHGYGRATGQADPMIHFYEDFLAQYDAGLRKDRGVWYTPLPVVGFIVRAVDEILETRFSLPDGLADVSKTEIEIEEFTTSGKRTTKKVRRSVHKVQVLDPALGTGTFIAECIRQIHAKFAGNEGAWPGYAETDLMPRLNGFELLMASYTMAHIKLDMTLAETFGNVANVANSNSQLPNGNIGIGNWQQFHNGNIQQGNNSTSVTLPHVNQRFKVFLTNSLVEENSDAMFGQLFALSLGEEARGADEVKRDTPVMVVIGNPPYSGISQNNGEWITRLVGDYKFEPGGKEKLQERKTWLNDDYVKFIRLAEHYIEKNGSGVVAYINPHGFLDNPTFRGMRWHLMQTFDEMYFLNLHGNAKKKETAPDGGKDECVFDIMQGVSINIFVKCGNVANTSSQPPIGNIGIGNWQHFHNGNIQQANISTSVDAKGMTDKLATLPPACRVFYADLWGKRAEKFAALDAATLGSIEWQELTPAAPMFFFVPKDTKGEEEYNKGFRVDELMQVTTSGFVTANDILNISFSEEEHKSKIRDLLDMPEAMWRAKYCRHKDSRDWRYATAKNDASKGMRCYMQTAYRPFDSRYTYYTGNSRGLYSSPQQNVMSQFIHGENTGLCCIRICSRDDELPVFVTDKITDKTILSSKDNANVFPLWLYEENMGKVERRANLNPEIVKKIEAAVAGRPPYQDDNGRAASPLAAEQIFDYIYGVLHSPAYREKYKEFLKTDFPRIPYPKDASEFVLYRDAGRALRETHLMLDPPPPLSEPIARFPVPGDNVVERVEMKKVANVEMLPIANPNIQSADVKAPAIAKATADKMTDKLETGNIGTGNNSTLATFLQSSGRVWINETQYFDNVPLAAWEQAIGGYHPAEKWLKDRKGRALGQEDIRHYQRIILALRRTREIMDALPM